MKESKESGVQPELMPVDDVARLLSVSRRTVWRMRDSGHLPAPVRLGGAIRWRRGDIENWIASGCPPVRTAKAKAEGDR
ncbi:MAG: helix-turn-helix domain-containing protein [Thermogutta sp.]|nr:helix-turn-helix domain-containing protein [Thermogutta sp.]